ncbi:alpha-glucan family phosphorylase [Acidiferrobacter sp.]|uniref:alpha-glucan family phosphorylase n=1 Tax=Acidiferrobacter sp. TaxID=1872107 RepID=UPI002628CAD7|nr:alpha-glucan family phosphorylase [Acidiferrobacter sp.]
MPGTRYPLEVQPLIPQRLARLTELAADLLYSWNRSIRALFVRLDPRLWEQCGRNPKLLLRRVAQVRLDEAAADPLFLEEYQRALSIYDTYHAVRLSSKRTEIDRETDLVAYFCAEFGLHESLQIYSGGLGILAGDHCKAASDLGLPFVAVGLLYRQGYFTQTIDAQGNQIVGTAPALLADLPVTPVCDDKGHELRVSVTFPGRAVALKVWRVAAGRICLYLLDSDVADNTTADRGITCQLYGGDRETRLRQEIVLGIGGVRALRALGLAPTVWHINEGHPAFQIVERTRELTTQGLDFDSALEIVAAGTVFTTHTPVPAGHDIFDQELFGRYLEPYVGDLGITLDELKSLGSSPISQGGFNMTALALRGSRLHNGVSRIHGGVASRMEAYIWPQIPWMENPVGYVTNGVHVATFLAHEWSSLFDVRFGSEWRNKLTEADYWACIDTIPDHSYWSVHQSLKGAMLETVHKRVARQHRRNGAGEGLIRRLTRLLEPDAKAPLVIGFARRFATYKRAGLLFEDPKRLARLLNNPDRPVLLLFAGKAHPHDHPGQNLIRLIQEFSRSPEFEGKVILIEGYDLALARRLVTGVDVWLNTPEYPMEASGTSGQKAAINGVVNLSVLDGWWGEGYAGDNGWGICPHKGVIDNDRRASEESAEVLDILEHQVVPLYFNAAEHGYSRSWIAMSKAAMRRAMPVFNAERMVLEYARDYYRKAADHARRLAADEAAGGRALARWKQQASGAWPGVRIEPGPDIPEAIKVGEPLHLTVLIHGNGLRPDDLIVECLFESCDDMGEPLLRDQAAFSADGVDDEGRLVFRLNHEPRTPGFQTLRIRAYPYHALLAHRFELGCMAWL